MDPHIEFDRLINASVETFYGYPLSATQRTLMHRALRQAQLATHPQWKLGAVIVANGNILSVGSNKYRNDPNTCEYLGISWHAEEVALNLLTPGAAEGARMYVARIARKGQISMARPCARCLIAIHQAGISSVFYTHPAGVGLIPIFKGK